VAVAVPGDAAPLVIDLAPGVVAAGKIRAAKARGERIPEGWALDPQGAVTTDPSEALQGALLAVGGHKGWALAIGVDMLTGLLFGRAAGAEVGGLDRAQAPQNTSHLVIALDPGGNDDRAGFRHRVEHYREALRSSLSPEGRLPGERSATRLRNARRDGVALPPAFERPSKPRLRVPNFPLCWPTGNRGPTLDRGRRRAVASRLLSRLHG
jgi:LDH2 family malate/lactate/ureidoglycolate dehydrogenase